jgi:hypothetical protein
VLWVVLMLTRILPQVLHVVENQQIFWYYIHRSANFVFLVSVIGVIIFNILNIIFKYLEKYH